MPNILGPPSANTRVGDRFADEGIDQRRFAGADLAEDDDLDPPSIELLSHRVELIEVSLQFAALVVRAAVKLRNGPANAIECRVVRVGVGGGGGSGLGVRGQGAGVRGQGSGLKSQESKGRKVERLTRSELLGPHWGNIDNFLWIWQSGSWSSGFSLPNDRNRGQTG